MADLTLRSNKKTQANRSLIYSYSRLDGLINGYTISCKKLFQNLKKKIRQSPGGAQFPEKQTRQQVCRVRMACLGIPDRLQHHGRILKQIKLIMSHTLHWYHLNQNISIFVN